MNTPLPSGWTAQYDANQRRYFFINHATKITTWDDPRFSQHPSAQQQGAVGFSVDDSKIRQVKAVFPALSDAYIYGVLTKHGGSVSMAMTEFLQASQEQVAAGGAVSPKAHPGSPEHGHHHKRPAPLNLAEDDDDESHHVLVSLKIDPTKVKEIKTLYPTCSESYIHDVLEKNMGSVSMAMSDIEHDGHAKLGDESEAMKANMFLVKKLKPDFPTVSREAVEEILISCKNIESMARVQLNAMENRSQEATSHVTITPPSTASSTTSPSHESVKSERGMSANEKHKLLTELCADFQGSSQMVVEMVLETTGYQEDNARSVLRSMGPEVKAQRRSVQSKASNNSHSSSPQKGSTKTTSAHKGSSKSSTPSKGKSKEALQRDSLTQAGVTTSEKMRLHSLMAVSFPRLSRTILETALQTCNYDEQRTKSLLQRETTVPASPRKLSTPSPPKTSTGGSPPDNQTAHVSDNTWIVSPEPESPVGDTCYKSIAKGPNPALPRGPDPSNLLSDYVQVKGPNASLCHGPDPANFHGSQKTDGPDTSIRCGAQTHLRRGPSKENLMGTLTAI